MSEKHESYFDTVNEALFFAADAGAEVAQRKILHGRLKANHVADEDKIDWLTQYFEDRTAPREELAWIQACKSFFGQLTTDELLVEGGPHMQLMTIPAGTDELHGLSLSYLCADPQLALDINRFIIERPYVADENEYRQRILASYYDNSAALVLQHSIAGQPYDDTRSADFFVYGGEMFGIKPGDEIIFERGERKVLPVMKDWRSFVNCVAAAEVTSFKAEAVANSLTRALRVDGQYQIAYAS